MESGALQTWREKLDHLLNEEAKTTGAAQKFEMQKLIEQAREKIRELQDGESRAKEQAPWKLNRFPSTRLNVTGKVFLGRDTELEILDRAWATGDAESPEPKINIVTFVGQGGEGKTRLVFNWRVLLARNGWRGAERVFDWSFFSQGMGDQGAVSAAAFFDAALRWFGEAQPELLEGSDKGERLATLIAEHRTLFILDGLEPLQNPPGPLAGQFKEGERDALKALLGGLAQHNRGMCILTTRQAVADLAPWEGQTCLLHNLTHLDAGAGAALLRALGVTGPEDELRRVAEVEFWGHALTLNLLGNYLRCATFDHNIGGWREVSLLEEDAEQGNHAHSMLHAYENWLGPDSREYPYFVCWAYLIVQPMSSV
jgi:hypothetical protein